MYPNIKNALWQPGIQSDKMTTSAQQKAKETSGDFSSTIKKLLANCRKP
jgi:hypothetical protein